MDLLLNDSPKLLLGEVFTANNGLFLLAHEGHDVVFFVPGLEDFHIFPDDPLLFSAPHIQVLMCTYYHFSAFSFISPLFFLQKILVNKHFFLHRCASELKRVQKYYLFQQRFMIPFKKTYLVLQCLPCARKLLPNGILCKE